MSAKPAQLEPQLRPDLEWTSHVEQARWVARDPLTASFFSLNEMEHAAAELLNGRHSLDVIVYSLQSRFPTAFVDRSWVQAFVARLRSHHLLLPNSPIDSQRLLRARRQQRGTGLLRQLLSPLAIRIPLFDPSLLLRTMKLPAALLFHSLVVKLWLVAGVCLLFLVLRQLLVGWNAFSFDLLSIRGERWFFLFLCYVVAKSLHELGHALACVRYRTECNEVGVMLLCLAPCLYCDTTDSWKLPSKWQRASIAAAGMYVELILASIAAAVWLLTMDGTLHYLAASMMMVCSVGTVLVNLNPLLKYDGYYILSDLWDVPNLNDQSREALGSLVQSAFTARRPVARRFDANVACLAIYAALASLYRTFVLCLILWIAWKALVPLGLGLVAIALTTVLLMGIGISLFRSAHRFYRDVVASGAARFARVIGFCALLLGGIVFVFKFPLPSIIRARAVTDFDDKIPLFAAQDSELVFASPVNIKLANGSPLLKFVAPASDLELVVLEGEIQVAEQELGQLQLRSAIDAATSYLIPSQTEKLTELRARARLLSREISNLTHSASRDGYLLHGPQLALAPIAAPRDDRFGKKFLEPSRIGSFLERGTLVGWFSSKQQLELTAIVSEHDVKQLALGLPVFIQWDSAPTDIARGCIKRIAPDPLSYTPPQLVGDANLISTRNELGVFQPEKPHYEVSVVVESPHRSLRGAPATIQIQLPSKSLVAHVWQYVQQNLRSYQLNSGV